MKKILFFLLIIQVSHAGDFLKNIKRIVENDPEYLEVSLQSDYQKEFFKKVKTTLFLPDVSLDLSKGQQKSSTDIQENDYSSYRLSAKYNLFNFGANFANYKAGKFGLESYKYNSKRTLLEREKRIFDKAFRYIYEQERLSIFTEITELKRKTYNVAKRRFKRGAMSKSDFLRVKIDYSNAKVDKISASSNLVDLKKDLIAYGVSIKSINKFPWKKSFLKRNILRKVKKEIGHRRENPRLEFYKAEYQKHMELAKLEKRKFWGDVSLGFSRSYYEADMSTDGYSWQGAITYTLPLFSNFSDKVAIYKAKASSSLAKANYDYYKRLTKAEISSQFEQFQFSLESLLLTEATLVDNKKLLKTSYSRFKSGKISVNALLTEQDQLIKTRLLSNSALLNSHKAFIEIIHNIGFALTDEKFISKFF